MELLRRPKESYTSYLKRIVQATREKQLNYEEMGNCLLGERNVYSSENLRKVFYALDIIADKLDEDIVITDEDLLLEIERQKDELYKTTQRLRDKKREINNDLRKIARFENLEQVLRTELAIHKPLEINKEVSYTSEDNVEASVLISDIHYGIEIENNVNKFNSTIAEQRMNTLVDRVIQYCEFHKVQTLHVELLGDLISGYINISNRVEQEEDLISQIIGISAILSSALNKLVSRIPTVNLYCVFGNHSRVNPNKKENLNRENYERLIFTYIQMRVSGLNKFITSDTEDYLCYTLNNDRKVVCTHGDKDNLSSIVTNYIALLGFVPNEIHLGHYHNFKIVDENDITIVVNGSIVGSDDYAVSIRKNTEPCQVLRIYSNDFSTYAIKL